MSSSLILAIDQGTTNTKALIVDGGGMILAAASVPMRVNYPQPGWAEQSASAIWDAVKHVIADVVAVVGTEIDALAISNQRETIVVWDASTGMPLAPAILWQCRRTTERCAAISAAGNGELVEDRTGLGIDPLFPAAKLAWLIENIEDVAAAAKAGQLRAGTVDAWLLWNLSGRAMHATDHSNASRTQLFNTRSLMWDDELGRIFGVPLDIMPRVMRSDSLFAEVGANITALRAGTPVHAMIGDSHAALYGQGRHSGGSVKATYGTGSSLMTPTARRVASRRGLSSTIGWSTHEGVTYALEGNISVSGQAVQFAAELLGRPDAASVAALAATVPDSNGVHFVPALVGLGAPHWVPSARGLIDGLSLGTKPAHVARAAVEAVAHQVADVFETMEADLGAPLGELSADGGASRNDMLMQFQADVIGRVVLRSEVSELSAVGAAMMAAHGLGRLAAPSPAPATRFQPAMPQSARDALRDAWRRSIRRTLYQDGDEHLLAKSGSQ